MAIALLNMDPKIKRDYCFRRFFKNESLIDSKMFYKPRDSDIICVGAPKSGSTWLQQIVHQIRTKGDESFNDIYDVVWYIRNPKGHMDRNFNEDQVCNPRIFKIHDAHGIIQTTKKQKHIVIIRDPYDAVYSWMRWVDGYYGSDEDISEDELIDLLSQFHKYNILSNFKNVPSWWEHRNDPNVLIIFYEDLKQNLKAMIKKISNFVELPLTEAELVRVTSFCTFEYMVKRKEKFQGENVIIAGIARANSIRKWSPRIGMVRPDGGQVGQGLKRMGPKLKSFVDEKWNETMKKRFGFENYQEMYAKNSLLKNT